MLKVVIADDEEHICRLINALVDWEAMGMEVLDFASNGLEAIELVNRWNPDLLITDIRMPGCDGIELIKHVKTANPTMEVVIISGHAEFSYAQIAMKYSVGNYLLKPINKTELNQTLLNLGTKIRERQNSETGLQQLIEQNQQTKQQMKTNLIQHLQEGILEEPTEAMLREGCGLQIYGGVYQTFCLKLDYDYKEFKENELTIALEKANHIIQANLGNVCTELVFDMKTVYGYGIVFYEHKKADTVKRVMRDCLNQLIMQKSILGEVFFTIAMSEVKSDTKKLALSLEETRLLIQERLISGTERLIDTMPREKSEISNKALEKYIRMISHSIQMHSEDEAVLAVEELKREVQRLSYPRGVEVLELVLSAGTALLMQVNYKNQKQANETFQEYCELCGTVEKLFHALYVLESSIIQEIERERENDVLRPVRLAKQYIRNHYNEQITLEEVSDVVGLSTSYFSALFKKETGEGFAKYLIGIRMEEAKRLLRESSLSIGVICNTVGYNDTKHFTHTFEKTAGLKPSAYRKLYG